MIINLPKVVLPKTTIFDIHSRHYTHLKTSFYDVSTGYCRVNSTMAATATSHPPQPMISWKGRLRKMKQRLYLPFIHVPVSCHVRIIRMHWNCLNHSQILCLFFPQSWQCPKPNRAPRKKRCAKCWWKYPMLKVGQFFRFQPSLNLTKNVFIKQRTQAIISWKSLRWHQILIRHNFSASFLVSIGTFNCSIYRKKTTTEMEFHWEW